MKITMLSGSDSTPHYVQGLLSGLAGADMRIDCIGSDSLKDAPILSHATIRFFNLRGNQDPTAPMYRKALRIFLYYFRLITYARTTDSRLFHIQWLNRFLYLDRTLITLLFKAFGKKLVFTAHNIDAAERDRNNGWLNKVTLKVFYGLVDHIIVHTDRMKRQLVEGFNVREEKITVIPHGIIDVPPRSTLTKHQARRRLAVGENDRVILFFGYIAPYKGLEYLIEAFARVREADHRYRLIVAGRMHKGCEVYWRHIAGLLRFHRLDEYVTTRIEFIPDADIELFFKSADVLALPYTFIFQSGLVFLAYNFGLPIIAADVGSLREYVVEGRTGFIFKPEDSSDLETAIHRYFASDLYRDLELSRTRIRAEAEQKYSWKGIAEKTRAVYQQLR